MKYAVIADVHGNAPALHLAMADALDRGAQGFLFAGDYCIRAPWPNEVVALLRKDGPGQIDIPLFQTGFACPNEFVVGYGLDYAERYRNLPYVGVLKPEIYM